MRVPSRNARGGRADAASLADAAFGVVVAVVRPGAAAERPSVGEGNAPRRMKPRRARVSARGEIRRRCAPTGRGMNPLKRGRSGSNAYSAESA
jgi:hypothetical protein